MKTSLRTQRLLAAAAGIVLATASTFALRPQEEHPTPSLPLQPDEARLQAFVELVRTDVQTEKATILAASMGFSEDEAFEFWPLYREYTLELDRLFDRRLALIRKHIGSFEHMTDEQARELAKDVFDLQERRLELQRSWFEKFAATISPKRAAQFFQIENQIHAAIDLRVAAALPLIR